MNSRNDILEHELLFKLIIHDFSNLTCQVLRVEREPTALNELAGELNLFFERSGDGKRFEAQVDECLEPVYRWQVEGKV